MSDDDIIHVKPAIAASAGVNAERYRLMCNHAARDAANFWGEQARRLEWIRFPTTMKNTSFEGDVAIKLVRRWHGSMLQPSCLDAPPATSAATKSRSSGRATIPATHKKVTYRELQEQVCRLRQRAEGALGIEEGRPGHLFTCQWSSEAAVAMLACARVGAIHAVVFGGFSPDSARKSHPGLRQLPC